MCKKTLVYGYGVSGKSAACLLLAMGKYVAVYDDNMDIDFADEVEDVRGKRPSDILKDVKLVVASPSIMTNNYLINLACEKNIEVISELELGYRNFSGDTISITGTNGKTTTTLLVKALLDECGIDAHAVGNIGCGFCSELSTMTKSSVAVVEASSFQLSAVELFAPKYAICLNISPDHIDYHKTMQNYIDSKAKIFSAQKHSDYAVVNYDDEIVRGLADSGEACVYFYSLTEKVKGAYILNEQVYFFNGAENCTVCKKCDISMKGDHNISNALAMVVVAKLLNIPNSVIKKVLQDFKPPEFRVEHICTYNDVKYYNDSKSTNIDSTKKACSTMSGETVLIMGGYDKGLCYSQMFSSLSNNINTIILQGANRDKVAIDASTYSHLKIVKCENISEAVNCASKIKCENVLFSPATSSYDVFKNYIERGQYFNLVVGQLTNDKISCPNSGGCSVRE